MFGCKCENCPCLYEPMTDTWYIRVQTFEWDSYNDDFIYVNLVIDYCPYCGKYLKELENERRL